MNTKEKSHKKNVSQKYGLPISYIGDDGFVLNQIGEQTIGYILNLPEIYTIPSVEKYEEINTKISNVFRLLPDNVFVHFQFVAFKNKYSNLSNEDDINFLRRSFSFHHFERGYLDNRCFVFLTSAVNLGGKKNVILEKKKSGIVYNKTVLEKNQPDFFKFLEIFENAFNVGDLNSAGFQVEKMNEENWENYLKSYFSLNFVDDDFAFGDITDDKKNFVVGNNFLHFSSIENSKQIKRISATDKYGIFDFSFFHKFFLDFPSNHILNFSFYKKNSFEFLNKKQRETKQISSVGNACFNGKEMLKDIEEFSEDVFSSDSHIFGMNYSFILFEKEKEILNSAILNLNKLMINAGVEPYVVGFDKFDYFFCGVGGNGSSLPSDLFFTSLHDNVALFIPKEANYRKDTINFMPHWGVCLNDRKNGTPCYLDLFFKPKKSGVIQNYNGFIVGNSGGGKSVLLNNIIEYVYFMGGHCIVAEKGRSMSNWKKMFPNDVLYYEFTLDNPLSYNIFKTKKILRELAEAHKEDTYDTVFQENIVNIRSLLLNIYKITDEEKMQIGRIILDNLILKLYHQTGEDELLNFNVFYEFVKSEYDLYYQNNLKGSKQDSDYELFNLKSFLLVLSPFYRGGKYDLVLNGDFKLNIFDYKIIVFELDKIEKDEIIMPVVQFLIMSITLDKAFNLRKIVQPKFKQIPPFTLLAMDECWSFVANKTMAPFLAYCSRTLRKNDGGFWAITQQLKDLLSSKDIGDILVSLCDTKIILDVKSLASQITEMANILSLTDIEVALIKTLNVEDLYTKEPFREAYFKSGANIGKVYKLLLSNEQFVSYMTDGASKTHFEHIYSQKNKNFFLAVKEYISQNQKK